MLATEMAGGAVVKKAHNRALQNVIDRSRLSIEYKHRNISAVLDALGSPYIQGYKPAVHYQNALFDAIEARIDGSDFQNRVADASIIDAASPNTLIYEPAPEMGDKLYAANPRLDRLVRKFDPARRDARARALGDAGEAVVFQAEQNRLSEIGRDDLAGKVRWVAKEDGDGPVTIFCRFRGTAMSVGLRSKRQMAPQRRLSGSPKMSGAFQMSDRMCSGLRACMTFPESLRLFD